MKRLLAFVFVTSVVSGLMAFGCAGSNKETKGSEVKDAGPAAPPANRPPPAQ